MLTVTVLVAPDRDFTVTAWSGSFAVRVLYDVLKRRHVEFGKREKKPFVAEPLLAGGGYVLSGIVEEGGKPHPRWGWRHVAAGEELGFRYHFLDEGLGKVFLEALVRRHEIEEPACTLLLEEVSVEQRGPPRPAQPEGRVVVREVEFLSPTSFQFYGRDVLYPSPTRLMLSALRRYSQVSGADTSKAAARVHLAVELANTPKVRAYRVDIGEGRLVPAFLGRATLVLRGEEDLPLLLAALELAQRLGVGISTSIGFGRISLLPAAPP